MQFPTSTRVRQLSVYPPTSRFLQDSPICFPLESPDKVCYTKQKPLSLASVFRSCSHHQRNSSTTIIRLLLCSLLPLHFPCLWCIWRFKDVGKINFLGDFSLLYQTHRRRRRRKIVPQIFDSARHFLMAVCTPSSSDG